MAKNMKITMFLFLKCQHMIYPSVFSQLSKLLMMRMMLLLLRKGSKLVFKGRGKHLDQWSFLLELLLALWDGCTDKNLENSTSEKRLKFLKYSARDFSSKQKFLEPNFWPYSVQNWWEMCVVVCQNSDYVNKTLPFIWI